MVEQKSLLRQDIKAYHLDGGLLFQFILSEFFSAMDSLHKLHASVTDQQVEAVAGRLQLMMGHHEDLLHGLSWRPESGALAKLRNYCTQFAESALPGDKIALMMQQYADQVWLIASQTTTAFKVSLKNGVEKPVGTALVKNVDKMDKLLKKLGSVILKVLARFKLNENVLFYLLRHQEHITSSFALSQKNQLFKKLFKDGVREAVQFMTSRYALRGFQQLIPIISNRAAELETKA